MTPAGFPRPGHPSAGLPPARPGLRALARAVDVVLVMVPVFLVLVPVAAWVGGSGDMAVAAALFLGWGVVVAYETLLVAATGQTIGKRAIGLVVIDTDSGLRPAPGAALARAALPAALGGVPALLGVPSLGVLWFVPYLWALADPDGRGLHDRASDTCVVMFATPVRGPLPDVG